MSKDDNKNQEIIQIPVNKIFESVKYVVPIYQRNYAWETKEIEALLNDILTAERDYYLGTLIVNQTDTATFEVIDGQQRLTTLFLLYKYLRLPDNNALTFEAREKYHRTLSDITQNNKNDEFYAKEVQNGYNIIAAYFKENENLKAELIKKLSNVYILRVKVPKNIDLNHYFEIMNTRGEQLEPHQILKAKIIDKLNESDRYAASVIWDSCADMDSYVQMNFTKDAREKIFDENWTDLQAGFFEKLKQFSNESSEKRLSENPENKELLSEILKKEKTEDKKNDDEENCRFESIISFPNFLLQVHSVMNAIDGNEDKETDDSLDDKEFLKIFEDILSEDENSPKPRCFVELMLLSRVCFDKYILKREYEKKIKIKQQESWSLKKLVKYTDSKNNDKPNYPSTYSGKDDDLLKILQPYLRITYTSPKTMHWVTKVLISLIQIEENNADSTPLIKYDDKKSITLIKDKDKEILNLLENYCREKIKATDYKNADYHSIERIQFTYLDYILYRDRYALYRDKKIYGYKELLDINPEIQFRNSIEHFLPQSTNTWDETVDGKLATNYIHMFGNLALVTVSSNSKFSDAPPKHKADSKEIEQSLKLKIMAQIVLSAPNREWTKELAEEHGKNMLKILEEDLSKS